MLLIVASDLQFHPSRRYKQNVYSAPVTQQRKGMGAGEKGRDEMAHECTQ